MIAETIDKIVEAFSPAAAIRRKRERSMLRAFGGYESGKQSRVHDRWNPSNRSADAEYLSHGRLTRARARDLYRNNAYARAIVRAWVRNVVGKGIRPQSRTESKPFNEAAEALFRRWQKTADISGRMNLYQMQELVLTEMLVAGEVLVHFVEDEETPFRPVPLALELIDIDRLAEDFISDRIARQNVDTGNELRMGIEYNPQGKPVAYHIKRSHPQDIIPHRHDIERIDAANILHLFRKERVGQTRGISMFAPVVWWLKNLGNYVENEVVASAIAACFGVAIKTIDGPDSAGLGDRVDGADTSDDGGNTLTGLEPGMIPRLLPGEDISVINPNRSANNADSFINLMLRSTAAGSGVGFERVSRDYSKTNFSSNRASELEDRREFQPMEELLDSQLNNPIWRRLMISGAAAGVDGFPNPFDFLIDQDTWLRAEWSQILGREWVDPKNEKQADLIAYEAGWLRQGHLVRKYSGEDLEEFLQAEQREEELRQQYNYKTPEMQMAEMEPTGTELEEVPANASP